jgi:uncharacterized protein (UPF0264 family)
MSVKILASVRDCDEARLALAAGVDVIDLKEPKRGALGAVPLSVVKDVVRLVDGNAMISATIGDMDLCPDPVVKACDQLLDVRVDVVKVGIFSGDLAGTLHALAPRIEAGAKIVAVLFADGPTMWQLVLPVLVKARFTGLMLDTADKSRGGLLHHLPVPVLSAFVQATKDAGLSCGLAGSLAVEDISSLVPLNPDFLGFRSALCADGRAGYLSPDKLDEVVEAVRNA